MTDTQSTTDIGPETSGETAVLTTSALFTAIAGIILVDAEILAVAGTAAYALSAAIGTGPVGLAVIGGLVGLPTLWLCWMVARLAIAQALADGIPVIVAVPPRFRAAFDDFAGDLAQAVEPDAALGWCRAAARPRAA